MDIVELLTDLPECLQAKVLRLALIKAADLPSFLLICKTTNSMLNESLWRQLYAAQGRHAPDNVDLLELKSSYFQRGILRHQEVAGEEARPSGLKTALPTLPLSLPGCQITNAVLCREYEVVKDRHTVGSTACHLAFSASACAFTGICLCHFLYQVRVVWQN